MHKNETYGKILLKQKHKQSGNQILNFAKVVAKNLPYDTEVVYNALVELLEENVLFLEGDFLIQKRMVKDYEISEKRAIAGKNGGTKTQLKTKKFAKAKVEANTESENEDEDENENRNFGKSENLLNGDAVIPTMAREWYAKFPTYTRDQDQDFQALGRILGFMTKQHSIADVSNPATKILVVDTFKAIAEEVAKENFWINKPLKSIANNIQEFYNRIKNPITNGRTKNQSGNLRADVQEALNKRFGSGQ